MNSSDTALIIIVSKLSAEVNSKLDNLLRNTLVNELGMVYGRVRQGNSRQSSNNFLSECPGVMVVFHYWIALVFMCMQLLLKWISARLAQ